MGGRGRGRESRVGNRIRTYGTSVDMCIAYLWCLGIIPTRLISIRRCTECNAARKTTFGLSPSILRLPTSEHGQNTVSHHELWSFDVDSSAVRTCQADRGTDIKDSKRFFCELHAYQGPITYLIRVSLMQICIPSNTDILCSVFCLANTRRQTYQAKVITTTTTTAATTPFNPPPPPRPKLALEYSAVSNPQHDRLYSTPFIIAATSNTLPFLTSLPTV